MTDTADGASTAGYGYNLVDLGPDRSAIDALPAGQQALVWLGDYQKPTCSFATSDNDLAPLVASLAGDRKVAGFYLADEADDALPTYGGHCPAVANQITARSQLVHRLVPGPFTYEVVTEPGNFAAFATATDIVGADPYPCRVGRACDLSMIPRSIAALKAAHVTHYWGVLPAFDSAPFRYPSAAELRTIIGQWQRSGWEGEQTFAWSYGGHSLSQHPDLLSVLGDLNHATPVRSTTLTTGPATGAGAAPTKVLVIMEENHATAAVFPNGMPYLDRLRRQYGSASAWSDVGHPSLPNYLAIFSGSSFNEPADCLPSPRCTYPGPSVFGQALAAGKTAKAYEQSMPSPCATANSGDYDVNHNPWAYVPSESAGCHANDVPLGTTTSGALTSDLKGGTLPDIGLVTPDLQHDAHDGTLATADRWLRDWIPGVLAGPDWRGGHLAIVVTFDEAEGGSETVPFVLIAPAIHHLVVGTALNHYALTRFLDTTAGLPPLRQAAGAADVAGMFGVGP